MFLQSHAEMWKTSRKSVAKAKRISIARDCREKEKKQPEQRVIRTKTRAMVKAAAESASTNQEAVTASTEVPQNVR
jgi:hypothetical protein